MSYDLDRVPCRARGPRYALSADPAGEGSVPPAAAPSFPDEIRPLFRAKYVRCHGGKATRGDLDLTTPAGVAGSPPTHPELLDWLAREFVRRGWSLKAMHRLMTTSAAYRQSSAVTAEEVGAESPRPYDPDNALYSRMPMVRLDAEQLYDTLLFAAGRLDETRRQRIPAFPVGPLSSRSTILESS